MSPATKKKRDAFACLWWSRWLLLVVTLFCAETRVWAFSDSGQSLSGQNHLQIPAFVGDNQLACRYDASDSTDAPNKTPVLVDSNLIARLAKDPTLGGAIGPNQYPVRSFVSKPELRNAVLRPESNLGGVPGIIDEIPLLEIRPDPGLAIDVRARLPSGRGLFGDGIIGAQAVENNIPLITNERWGKLPKVVEELGGKVVRVR